MPPTLEIEASEALPDAGFALVEARVRWDDRRQSTGWGRDRQFQVATEKAVCEAVERHAQQCLPAAARWGPATAVGRHLAPGTLVRHAAWQYDLPPDDRPHRFDPREPRCWLDAQAVDRDEPLAVLADCICNPRAFDADYRQRLVMQASSSGCASGFELDDAILRAALELLERDALMRHWFAQAPGLAVDPSTLPEPFRARLERLADAGATAGIQGLTLGVHPTWLAWAQHGGLHFTSFGSASGLDPEAALHTALQELETQALARLAGVPAQPIEPAQVRQPADHAALYATAGHFRGADALLHPAGPARPFDALAAGFVATPRALYARSAAQGHPLHWVDLSVPEARGALDGRSIHTVRVLGPELIPMGFGLAQAPLGMDRWQRTSPPALHPFA